MFFPLAEVSSDCLEMFKLLELLYCSTNFYSLYCTLHFYLTDIAYYLGCIPDDSAVFIGTTSEPV
jgi:hypothetical protein